MERQRQRTIGPYILNQTLGKGQTGVVRLGVHCTTKEKVAVKIIDRTKLNPQILEKVEREIAIMKLIEHPHVLRLYDVYENNTHLFLILEYVGGGELFDYLVKRGRLTINEAKRFFSQIISAVDFCHKHCVCHRDLKPENLLLDVKNNIKVADFGMASLQVDDNSMLETSCGSPHYACPEVVKGIKYDGRKADIWSCGVILYALVVGVLPFDDDNLRQLLEKVKTGAFSVPNSVPNDCQDLIKEMIKVDPEKRFTIKQILNHSFLKSLDIHEQRPVQKVVKTEKIYGKDNIDPDVLSSMNSLGCFKDKEALEEELMKDDENMEKVMYFLLLERKERRPSSADIVPKAVRQMAERIHVYDPPRKRVDSCGSPRLNRLHESNDKESFLVRPRAETDIRSLESIASTRKSNTPLRSRTPPGSPWWSRMPWTKKSNGHDEQASYPIEPSLSEKEFSSNLSLEVSPSSVKKSWFAHLPIPGHSHSPSKYESIIVVIKEKPMLTIKADISHAFLTIPHVTHNVTSSTTFTAEYRKHKGNPIFRKYVRMEVTIEELKEFEGCSDDELAFSVIIKFISGSSKKFKKICDKLQFILQSNDRSPRKNGESMDDSGMWNESSKNGKKCRGYVVSDTESDCENSSSPDIDYCMQKT